MKLYKRGATRNIAVAVALLGSILFGTSALAMPISGSFSLMGDAGGSYPNQIVASGTFTTDGMDVAGGYTDGNSNAFTTQALTLFTLNDLTGGSLANYVLTDFVPVGSPIAVLNNIGEVIGFTGVGNAAATATVAGITVALLGPDFPFVGGIPPTNMIVPGITFSSSGSPSPIISISGLQVIPEPSAIALLGAGLFAFGFTRRIQKKNKA